MLSLKSVNVKSDLFASGLTFGGLGLIRLISSTILTRLLRPEAYGIIAILMSIIAVVEMLADVGVTMFIIRDKRGDHPAYLDTAWSIRLIRALICTGIVFFLAPSIASLLYDSPSLGPPLRTMSLYFFVGGLESMSFAVAIRRKRSRIFMYSELWTTLLSTILTVVYCYYFHNYWAVIYGFLANRIALTAASHFIYPELRPRFRLDRTAAREMLRFTRYVMPSSLLTLAITQFDKIIFLRFFSLPLLGIYGLGANIAQPIESLVIRISQTVLFPRCAHDFRAHRESYSLRYYTENTKLIVTMLLPPALLAGSAHFLIAILYDSRYAEAAAVLEAFSLRAALRALAMPAEDMLFAAGETRLFLVGEVYRAVFVFVGSLVGYYLFGFIGFCYGIALSGLPPLLYFWWLQRKKGFFVIKYEALKVGFICCVAAATYLTSDLFLIIWRIFRPT